MYHVDYVAYHGAFFFNGQMVTRIQAHDIGIGALTTWTIPLYRFSIDFIERYMVLP